MSRSEKREQQPEGRRVWTSPELKAVGTIGEMLRNGGGKPSLAPGDPGEPRKVGSQG